MTFGTQAYTPKKFDEAEGLWQARVNEDWRFYFTIKGDTYYIENIRSHPK